MSKSVEPFAVIRNDREYVIADPDAPLATGCPVVVKIAMGDRPRWFEGVLATKRPNKAKTLDVDLDNGFRERRILPENVVRVIGLYARKLLA